MLITITKEEVSVLRHMSLVAPESTIHYWADVKDHRAMCIAKCVELQSLSSKRELLPAMYRAIPSIFWRRRRQVLKCVPPFVNMSILSLSSLRIYMCRVTILIFGEGIVSHYVPSNTFNLSKTEKTNFESMSLTLLIWSCCPLHLWESISIPRRIM